MHGTPGKGVQLVSRKDRQRCLDEAGDTGGDDRREERRGGRAGTTVLTLRASL